MKSFSQLSLQHNRLMLAVVFVLMGFGLFSYFSLPAQEDPTITIREAVVTTQYPGLPADKVELLITKTLEEAARKLPEIKEIRSISMTGQSILHVKIQDRYFELEQIWDDLRDELEQVQSDLPEGTSTPLVNDNFGDVAVLTVALVAEDSYTMGEQFDIAQHVRDSLFRIEGVKRIDLLGVLPEQIVIEINNSKLAQMNMSPAQLVDMLQQQNIIQPGGTVDTHGTNYTIQPSGYFQSVEAVANALIAVPGQQETMLLKDIATIKRQPVDPPTRTAWYNGRKTIVFAIAQNDHVDVLKFSPQMEALIDELNQTLPAGFSLETITRQADVVEQAVNGVSINVLETLAIVCAVVILFLGVRAGLIVGAIVPGVILLTIAVMAFSGMVLERMSLATLIISLGILVDNGIVVAEDYKRRLEDGESKEDALANCSRSLAFPLLTSSATTILAFLPLMLADSAAGEYTRSISIIILVSLLVSWLLSQTITPYLCYHFISAKAVKNHDEKGIDLTDLFAKINPFYEVLLRKILNFRITFMALMVLLFLLGGFGLSQVPAKFFPDSDRSQILIYLDLPAGSSIRETEQVLQRVFHQLDDKERFPHVKKHVGYGGFGGPRFVLSLTPVDPEPSKGFIMVDVGERKYAQPTINALREMFAAEYPGVFAQVTKMFLGPSDSSKIEIQVKGPDKDLLFQTAQKMEHLLQNLPGSFDIKNDWENRVTQIKLDISQQKARRAGVSSSDIARTLNTYFSGRVISEFLEGDDVLPIVIRANDNERFNLARIESVNIYSQSRNVSVPLTQVAEIRYETGFSRISRENLFRTITVEAKSHIYNAEEMVPKLADAVAKLRQQLPYGYVIEYDGVIEESATSQASLNKYLPMCLGLIILILIAQFRSYRKTLIILFTIPLIIIGAALGLLIMQGNFGFMVILGLYALAGIIVNNGIVLIERIDTERDDIVREKGDTGRKEEAEAVIQASVRRLRPILMSTFTTILGLLPLMLSGDVLFYGMASAISFGLAIGTVLSLGVVPVLYSLMFSLQPEK
ncbi:efflux RND transporter permease subunit [Alteromonas pelagimontana]|uniref:Efflux RND transporter permease subunit n=1 Tax=Alteromonas pelagimontana TaxID=1858656 RepID=A0A6M4MC07_9ALTE|nr:efflux RND transporter permease subunit [Alteromonas pelagimontana]QJR80180.1 efflux RND transporter permease subunit [Alteromonas pelagimontana]